MIDKKLQRIVYNKAYFYSINWYLILQNSLKLIVADIMSTKVDSCAFSDRMGALKGNIVDADGSTFPRTFVVSAGCDVLLTEQHDFVKKMRKSGNECQQIVLDGAIHGFAMYGKEFDQYNTDILKQIAEWI
ncbi:MAG: alpha/beta hydrolase fold domain-containing protein [Alphaproteobacteria bacterium]|nr:alpha/beta hydrolase fold domain-containing protein [Alphaproteobacteria bacterium]